MTWRNIAELKVRGQTVMIKDSMIMLSGGETEPEWPYVKSGPGNYLVQVKSNMETCESVRVSRISSTVSLGRRIGEVNIDHGSFGILDYDSFLNAVSRDTEAYSEWTEMELFDVVWDRLHGKIEFSGESFVYGRAGEGDGVYEVFELTEGNVVVGLECTFG